MTRECSDRLFKLERHVTVRHLLRDLLLVDLELSTVPNIACVLGFRSDFWVLIVFASGFWVFGFYRL